MNKQQPRKRKRTALAVAIAVAVAAGMSPTGVRAESVTLQAKGEPIEQLVTSPDGKTLAAVSQGSGTVSFWKLPSGKALPPLVADDKNIAGIAFSPDGKRMATAAGSDAKQIKIWKWLGRKLVRTLHSTEAVESLSFSRNGARLITANRSGVLQLWDAAKGTRLAEVKGAENDPARVAFSDDGDTVAVLSSNTVRIWDFKGDQPKRRGTASLPPEANVSALAVSADGKALAVLSDCLPWKIRGSCIRLWDLADGKPVGNRYVVFGGEDIGAMAFSRDGRFIAWAGEEAIRLSPVRDGGDRPRLDLQRGIFHATSLVFSARGNFVIAGNRDGKLRLSRLPLVFELRRAKRLIEELDRRIDEHRELLQRRKKDLEAMQRSVEASEKEAAERRRALDELRRQLEKN